MADYPKAKYHAAANLEGDMKAYEQTRHAYISTTVFGETEEEALGAGWVDHPDELRNPTKKVPEVPKREVTKPTVEEKAKVAK